MSSPPTPGVPHLDEAVADRIDVTLVRRLVAEQFPHWAQLPIRPVEVGGWDNRTFHLGDTMTVRLPSGEGYALQVAKEQRWLPVLAPRLPVQVPTPLAHGRPGAGYPYPWSVYRWIDGQTAHPGRIRDLTRFATDLAAALRALRRVDATDGPAAGPHSAWRGGDLSTYDGETRAAIEAHRDRLPVETVTGIWQSALDATWAGPPVWFHGDVADGNLLVRDGRLAALIDFGCCGVGDPACDTVIAWTLLCGASRAAFRDALGLDAATWARGRGWALWKALITLDDPDPARAAGARHVLGELLTEHAAAR
ncbi:aminoglycoside phosphotransferase family protein [Micromonospora sp. LAH09]|uniref:aminoglycoside phosphotransferase family protein n=1 Tax=Micromonospora cabrerizensis TaxID=2911213 RepID=UPI001EE799C8|nr:aminoglycoside phosphotransferase family protein [Micromonospora cabrerizensis]MCG5469997.1 aminoglycoside phosphotransferase family protein [Micromonospora cabrerizensis]